MSSLREGYEGEQPCLKAQQTQAVSPAGSANWFQQRNPTSISQDLDGHPLWVCRNRLYGPVVSGLQLAQHCHLVKQLRDQQQVDHPGGSLVLLAAGWTRPEVSPRPDCDPWRGDGVHERGSHEKVDYTTFPGALLSSFCSLLSGASVGPKELGLPCPGHHHLDGGETQGGQGV